METVDFLLIDSSPESLLASVASGRCWQRGFVRSDGLRGITQLSDFNPRIGARLLPSFLAPSFPESCQTSAAGGRKEWALTGASREEADGRSRQFMNVVAVVHTTIYFFVSFSDSEVALLVRQQL